MISIITPVYNGERFIESCIKVVIDQACPDVEHIIVDGNSTDRTLEIIKQYAQNYPHIRWISEKDRGQSDAMNKGIALAKHKSVGILNVDDFYQPNVLNRVREIFTTLPDPSFLVGNCNVWNESGKISYVNKPSKLRITDLLQGFDINPHPVNPSAYFYHKSLHLKIGYYSLEEDYAMDVDFIFKAVQHAKVKYIDEIWGNYRMIPGTKSFSDIQTGQSLIRMEILINLYIKNLPLLQQIQIPFFKKIHPFKTRVIYFYRYPERLIPSIQQRASKIINKT